MTHTDFSDLKAKARQELGPGTLICNLSEENLREIRRSAYALTTYKSQETYNIPQDMMHDVIFHIKPVNDVTFELLKETD